MSENLHTTRPGSQAESLADLIRRRVAVDEPAELTDEQVEHCARILAPVLTRSTDVSRAAARLTSGGAKWTDGRS